MFTIPKTPQEFFKPLTDFYAVMPKTPEATKEVLEKVQTVFKTEFTNSQDMVKAYQKSLKGDATPNELASANKQAIELAKLSTFATLVSMPGGLIALPTILEAAKEYDIDLVPKSVAAQFNI